VLTLRRKTRRPLPGPSGPLRPFQRLLYIGPRVERNASPREKGEPGGVDSADVFRGLHEIGYRGYVTVHQAFAGIMPIETAVERSADFLRPLMRTRPPAG